MTNRFSYSTCLSALFLFIASFLILPVSAQDAAGVNIKGVVVESGTGLPLKQVSISVTSTGKTSETDEQGAFTIVAPNNQAELIIDLPGYIKRNVYINGRDMLHISLVSSVYRSFDNSYNSPLGGGILKDATNSVTSLVADDIKDTKSTTFDQTLQGRIPGLSVINQSGMPGGKTFMNIRGYSTLYGNVQPILFIDGMIHDYSSSNKGLLEGFSLNPMDIVDVDDISDISVQKDGTSYLGAAGSNGVININTEQKSETSTIIKFSLYEGVSMAPVQQDVLNAGQFKTYFNQYLSEQGNSTDQINSMYPWLNGDATSKNYYKYNNNTDWQSQVYKPAFINKYHFFLKGGDDIATYNISTGYLKQNGILDGSSYNRFNLRINGKINITNKFSITPNAKLSLADSYTPNVGPSVWKNAVTSALLMPPIMAENARDKSNGTVLNYLDNTGDVFNVSNPGAITRNASGSNRNYQFLSSLTAQYKFSEKLILSELVGIDFNNSRENIFLPDLGMIRIKGDSAYNSPGDFVNDFRSMQSHTNLSYTTKSASGHNISLLGGFRYLQNSYKYNLATSANTASDDFKTLGDGNGAYGYLFVSDGDYRGLKWLSTFANINYNFRNKYFLNAVASYDGNSAVNNNARYNFFPSVSGAWRISSESFLSQASWLDDMKLRASWSLTGNMFSNVYDYSKLYYVSERWNSIGVLTREAIPNDNLELEKKATTNFGLDMTIFNQAANIHFDYFQSKIDNMIIQQELPSTYGYTNYYDNGGKLDSKGFEISADTRFHFGSVVWTVGASISKQLTNVNSLSFINPAVSNIITPFDGGQYITSVGNAVNAFYGYQTNGIYQNDAEASQISGPNGMMMQAGDVKYVDMNNDKMINDADKKIIGNPNPDFFGGFNTGLSYKNFELAAYFTYSSGSELFNYVRYKTEGMDDYSNQSTAVLDRWTTTNPSNTMPKASYGDPRGNTAFSDRWIEDGSYVRLKQLTLNYSFPPRTGVYKGLTVYLTGTNLLTFTKYSGYDPDFLYSNDPFHMGIDYGKIPQPKSFIIGLKLDL